MNPSPSWLIINSTSSVSFPKPSLPKTGHLRLHPQGLGLGLPPPVYPLLFLFGHGYLLTRGFYYSLFTIRFIMHKPYLISRGNC